MHKTQFHHTDNLVFYVMLKLEPDLFLSLLVCRVLEKCPVPF